MLLKSKSQVTPIDNTTLEGRCSFIFNRISQIRDRQSTVILYKKFLSLIFKDLENYLKPRNLKIDYSKRPFNSSISEKFDNFYTLIDNFDYFLQNISKKDQTETILESSFEQDVTFIDNFRDRFNFYVIDLQLFAELKRPLSYKPTEEARFQVNDIIDYKKLINDALQCRTRYSEQNIKILTSRLTETEAYEEKLRSKHEQLIQEKIKLTTIIDMETLEQEIKKVTNSIIDNNDLNIQKELARGGEGIVKLGYQKSTERVVAVKELISGMNLDYEYLNGIKRQIQIMTELTNFSILQFIGVSVKPVSIITDYMPNGSLFDRLKDSNPETQLTPTKRTIIALGIAYSLNYLHTRNPPLLHRDVKSLNVLLDSEDFPKLCDFGMSVYKTEKSILGIASVGTPNWMAPEVIKGIEYTEKSDVYSYAVVLWELLTGMTPFEDISHYAIPEEVAYNNRRLDIQRHDCPPKFRELLSKCWSVDPSKRPSFPEIIEKFESGEVKFIGTQMDQVKAYISLFQNSSSTAEESFDFPVITDSIVNSICNELEINNEEAILKANAVLVKEENHQFILQFKLIKSICKAIDKCESTRAADYLTRIVDLIVKYDCLRDQFEKEDGSAKFIRLFIKFGATTKKNIIDTLIALVSKASKVAMNYNAISKISPFLLYNNLSCRLSSVKLLNLICELKCYDSENSFNIVIRNVLANIFPKAKIEVIIESLNLILKLVKLPELNLSILATEGVIRLTEMINHSNLEVSMKSLKIIEELLKLTVTQKNVVKAILAALPEVTKNQNNDQIKEILIIMAYLLKSKVTISKIQSNNNKEVIDCFKQFLSSSDTEIVINSLKLCFSFIYNSVPKFMDLYDNYLSLLSKDDKSISVLAASCLTLVYQKRPFKLADSKNNDIIKNFLKRELSSNSSTIHMQILNLCGVISTSLDGSIFFDDIDIISLILNIIKSSANDTKISKTATMVLASLSALNPLCKHISEAFPQIFSMLKNDQNSPYPIIFITNMASTTNGALECAKNISDIVNHAEKDFARTIIAIQRTITDEKAKNEIFSRRSESAKMIVALIQKKWKVDNVFLSIVNEMAAVEAGRKAIVEAGMVDALQRQFNEIGLANESRPLLLRILSRIKS